MQPELFELPPSVGSGEALSDVVLSGSLDSASVFISGGGLNLLVSIGAPGVQPGFKAIASRVVLKQLRGYFDENHHHSHDILDKYSQLVVILGHVHPVAAPVELLVRHVGILHHIASVLHDIGIL